MDFHGKPEGLPVRENIRLHGYDYSYKAGAGTPAEELNEDDEEKFFNIADYRGVKCMTILKYLLTIPIVISDRYQLYLLL